MTNEVLKLGLPLWLTYIKHLNDQLYKEAKIDGLVAYQLKYIKSIADNQDSLVFSETDLPSDWSDTVSRLSLEDAYSIHDFILRKLGSISKESGHYIDTYKGTCMQRYKAVLSDTDYFYWYHLSDADCSCSTIPAEYWDKFSKFVMRLA